MERYELVRLLLRCRHDASVIFCVNVDGPTEAVIGFVRYCVRDNVIYLYESEPEDFAQEEDIEIYETRRANNFVETSYRER